MNKRTSILIIIASLIFLSTVSFAADKDIEALRAELSAAQSQIKVLQKENKELKERLASREKEIAGYKATLEKIEGEIKALKDGE